MGIYRLSLLAVGSLGVLLAQSGAGLLPNDAYQIQDLGYKRVPDWPSAPKNVDGSPGEWNLIETVGIATDSQGHVLVLHRGAYPILEFDSAGTLVRAWGDGLFSEGKVITLGPAYRSPDKSFHSAVYGPMGCTSCGAHTIRVDPEGNIWIIDAPGQMIYKMDPKGKVIFQLGEKGVPGSGPNRFNLPTDVAFAPTGEFYISDGYGNSRVLKYTHDGKFLLEWGKLGSGPGEFRIPHGLAVDARGRVYVSDRENHRVQIFDANGKFLNEWTNIGTISALVMTKDQKIWTGSVLRDLDGKVLGRMQVPKGALSGSHSMAVSDAGDVYLAHGTFGPLKYVKK